MRSVYRAYDAAGALIYVGSTMRYESFADGVVAYEAAIGAVPAGHTLTLQHGARVIRSSEVAR